MKNLSYILLFIVSVNNLVNANNTTLKTKSSKVVKHDVYFDTDKHQITKEEFTKLVQFLNETKDVDIERMSIVGYCDDRGNANYNKTLSNKRAEAIKKIIISYRNSTKQPEILNVKGKGEVALNTKEEALFKELRALNRKVSIVIAPKKLIAGSFFAEDVNKGDLINLKSLNFVLGYRYLTPESKKTLQELADFLVKRTDIFFTINGHVCCTENGRESRDRETGKLNLSVVRAKYIRDYLVKAGVDAKRVRYQGLAGKYNLGGSTKEDRRVEILIRHISK